MNGKKFVILFGLLVGLCVGTFSVVLYWILSVV